MSDQAAGVALSESSDQLDFRRVVATFVRTWPFIRPSTRHIVNFVAISIVAALTGALLGLLLIQMATAGVMAGKPIGGIAAAIFGLDPAVFVTAETLDAAARRALLWPCLILAIVGVAIGVGAFVGLSYYSVWIFQAINQRMRLELIDRLNAQSLSFHANAATGDAIYRVYQDSAMVTAIIRYVVLEPLMFLGRYVFSLAVVAAFNPTLALVLAFTLVPILLIGRWFSPVLRRRFRRAREENSRLTSWIQESVLGIRIIKATGSEHDRLSGFRGRSHGALGAAFDARVTLAIYGIVAFGVIGSVILIMLAVTALLSNTGASTFATNLLLGFGFAVWNFGTFSSFNERAGDGLGSLRSLIALWGRAQDMAVGLRRIFAILDLEPEIRDAPDARPFTTLEREIEFADVSFAYGDRELFRGVSFRAAPGSVTAIVGPTGVGKTTLMSLLLRLADPRTGAVRIDGTDVRDFTVASLRRNVAIATQENVLFSLNVLENIRYAAPEASPADAVAAARVACADAFIEALPEGFETALGERATKLSSGQRQRLVIARAVVKDTPILILDEPTAALDAETELRVLERLKRWGEGRAIFLITHRLSTIRQADQVVFLRDGGIDSIGRHDDLLEDGGSYAEFVAAETGA